MKNLIKLVLFLIYTFTIFIVNSYYIIGIIAVLNLSLMLLAKPNVKKSITTILNLMPFIVFTGVINVLLDSLNSGILIMARLILVCNVTYTFKYILSPMGLANAIEILLYPLKVFKVNSKDISLMICICIAFIPILSSELTQIKYALNGKGMKIKLRNFKYILKPFLYGIFKRTDDVSNALKAKAYAE